MLTALAVVGPLACGDNPTAPGDRGTTTPGTGTPGSGNPGTGTSRITVAQYMDSALTLMQAFSVNESINWPSFRSTWSRAAAGAQSYAATYPIIQQALSQLDPHSSISPPDRLPGSTDAPTNRPDLQVQGRMVTPRVAYLWIPGFVGRSQQGRVDTTHMTLRTLDANDPCGWIVDLRANSGGFFFALMASVGPLYATNDPFVGGQRYTGNYRIFWYYKQRGANDVFGIRDARDSAEMTIANPFRPKRPGLPVAVLHSTATNDRGQYTSITASAGESITLAFRSGPPTRSFGLPTFGVASGRSFAFMPDSARIDVTDSYMFDRRGYTPGDGPIPPDTTIASPSPLRIGNPDDPVIAAAAAWLQARPECTGQGVQADRSPSPARAPVILPTVPSGRNHTLPTPRSVYERRLSTGSVATPQIARP